MITKIKDFFNQPYPDGGGFTNYVKNALIAGLVVFGFLAYFQPYELDQAGGYATRIAFYFGLITMGTSLLVDSIAEYIFKVTREGPTWVFWKWLVSVLFLISCIAVANFLFVIYMVDRNIQVAEFFSMLKSTLAVGIFPTFILGSLTLNRRTRMNQKIAEDISPKDFDDPTSVNISLPVKNSTKTFEIDASKIIFLEAMQNYVQIYYLHDNAEIKKEMHRNTISALESVLQETPIKRCHRSYLVNANMIQDIKGNAQGLKLEMKFGDGVVPVSRKYIEVFRKL